MIKITKEEAFYLRSKGKAYDVHMSSKTHKARAKRYYLTESIGSLALLKQYRDKQKVKR